MKKDNTNSNKTRPNRPIQTRLRQNRNRPSIILQPQEFGKWQKSKLQDNWQGFSNTFTLTFKRYLRSPVTYLLYLIPLALILGVATVMPADKVFTTIMALSIIVHSFIVYGTTWFTISTSSTYTNIKITQYKQRSQFISIFCLTFLTTFIFAMGTLLLVYLFQLIPGFYATDWPWGEGETPTGLVNFSNGYWANFMYYIIVCIFVSIALCLFASVVTKTSKSYMFFMVAYIIFVILFGSLIIFPFNALQEVDPSTGAFIPLPSGVDSVYDPAFVPTTGVYILIRPDGHIFEPTSFTFWIEQFIPHYSINAWGYSTMAQFTSESNSIINEVLYFTNFSSEWLYITIMPWVWIVGLITFSSWRIKRRGF